MKSWASNSHAIKSTPLKFNSEFALKSYRAQMESSFPTTQFSGVNSLLNFGGVSLFLLQISTFMVQGVDNFHLEDPGSIMLHVSFRDSLRRTVPLRPPKISPLHLSIFFGGLFQGHHRGINFPPLVDETSEGSGWV